MKAYIDSLNRYQEITFLSIIKLEADILLGIQRGIDVYFQFLTEHEVNGKKHPLKNVRCLHFTGPHKKIWDETEALNRVIAYIDDKNIVISNPHYIKEETNV